VTQPQLGATAIRAIGVWWVASAVVEALTVGAALALPGFNFAFSREFAILNLLGAGVRAVVAAACLAFADRISTCVFKPDTPTVITVRPADRLSVGICVVGVVFVGSNISELLQTAALAFWYAESSRQVHLPEALKPSARSTIDAGLSLALGVVLALYAGRLADWLTSRFPKAPMGRTSSEDAR
jgi:hypothetical protein